MLAPFFSFTPAAEAMTVKLSVKDLETTAANMVQQGMRLSFSVSGNI